MAVFARHSLPRTWIAFVILSAITSTIIGYWPPHIASPWPTVALISWLLTALVVFEAREIRSHRAIGAMIVMTVVLISIVTFAPRINGFSLNDKLLPPTPVTSQTTISKEDAMKKADQLLQQNNWKPGDYILEAVDKSKDKSTPGQGAFSQQNKKAADDMISFLKLTSASSSKLTETLISSTGGTKDETLDPINWVVVQSMISFKYTGNTMINSNGKVVNVGQRDGSAGDIMMIFISPSTGKAVFVRGACANPQTSVPTPAPAPTPVPVVTPVPTPPVTVVVPTPTPPGDDGGHHPYTPPLVAKDPSQDPVAKGNAPVGGGSNQDPNPGVYNPPGSGPAAVTQPPVALRVNPVVITTPVVVTPDPTPAPVAEVAAPTPAAPATGYSAPPGGQ